MAFHEIQFPTDISYGSKGGPCFNTDIIVVGSGPEYLVMVDEWAENVIQSGYEQRNINWAQARCEFDVAYGITTGTQLQVLIDFFQARWGKAHGFRYKDWSDYQAVLGSCLLITNSTYQLRKNYRVQDDDYPSSYYYHYRTIKKPVTGTVSVYRNGIIQSSGWTVDTTTGIITFASPPGGTITATFEFDVPVRFDIDQISISLDSYNAAGQFFGGASVPLVEIRV